MKSINQWTQEIVEWRKSKGFKTDYSNIPEKLLLIITEIAEATEEHRQTVARWNEFGKELVGALIRILDLLGSLNYDVEYILGEEMALNRKRPHKHSKRY